MTPLDQFSIGIELSVLVLRYTYGKPVQGSVRAEVCRSSFGYQPEGDSNICEKYNLGLTDPSGCATQVVDVTLFRLDQHGYQDVFDVHAELEESGTGKERRMGPLSGKGRC